jgi:hypothetical protein
MQKLITIRIRHTSATEHLEEYLSKGWRVISTTIAMTSDENEESSAFLAVVIEKDVV